MRRRYAAYLPEFSRQYGIRPWELEQLTIAELRMFLTHFETMKRDAEEAARGR